MMRIPDADLPDVTDGGAVPSTGSGTAAARVEGAEVVGAPGIPASTARQSVVRVRGSRRARLLPAPGTTAEPAPADDRERGAGAGPPASGPNDDRMLRDVPPHY
ncbi:hypothetical protein ACIPVB_09335 [Microbacterium sp. NPDC090007]|uniref:hypothetical protein n=1 Tax=Microbacterium sp. NPDC090007 TaxID=3364204 RepID=UPI00381B8130